VAKAIHLSLSSLRIKEVLEDDSLFMSVAKGDIVGVPVAAVLILIDGIRRVSSNERLDCRQRREALAPPPFKHFGC